MTKNPGFFATLFSICRGTEDFPEFVRRPFMKVFIHFLLLALLVSLAVASWQSVKLDREFSEMHPAFVGAFGEKIIFDERGVFPGRDEERARSIVLPHKGRLCYAGGNPDAAPRVLGDLGGVDYLLFWRSGTFTFAGKRDDSSWLVVRPGEKTWMLVSPDREAALQELLAEPEPRNVAGARARREPVSVERVETVLLYVYWSICFAGQFFTVLVTALISTGLFTLFFSWGVYRRLTGIDLWKSGLYAGFPAMIIAGCFPLFELPFFTYAQVYLVALFIYWLRVVSRVERARRDEETRSQGGFHDNR